MKIFNTAQIRDWDNYTIAQEPIASIDLMNRAAAVFTRYLLDQWPACNAAFHIVCGTGNNGGDGLAVARLLFKLQRSVQVSVVAGSGKHSPDFDVQLKVLPASIAPIYIAEPASFPKIQPDTVIIDAIFGSGLSRTPEGIFAKVIEWINQLPNPVIAIDLPSGLFPDEHTPGIAIQADETFSFQTPKRAFFFPENVDKVGSWSFGDIGLHSDYEKETSTPFYYLTTEKPYSLLKKRQKFDHKGTFGHALLICGSYGKMGAALLSARACMRTGAGLLTIHAPVCGHDVLQAGIPEAMFSHDQDERIWTNIPDLSPYKAIGIGCGIGTSKATAMAMEALLKANSHPIVIDADALNLLSLHPEWWPLIPPGIILTPHPKEFERLFGPSPHNFARNDLQRQKAQQHQVVIILKGANTAIVLPNGDCWFNSTGNPGMATGGSGDVLTGMITSLLAQQYTSESAALLGVFLHGKAGDLAAAERGMAGMMAGDIVEKIGRAMSDE